jgi:plastocyanin
MKPTESRRGNTQRFLLASGVARRCRRVGLAVLVLLSTAAAATDHTVGQRGRAFSVDSMTVAKGEPVVFLNDDTVPHNIMSQTPENAFDLGVQSPGSATPVSFDVAGTVVVICAIHPQMHMSIIVTP